MVEVSCVEQEELLQAVFEFLSLQCRRDDTGTLPPACQAALDRLEAQLARPSRGTAKSPVSRPVMILLPDMAPIETTLLDIGARGAQVVAGAWALTSSVWMLCRVRLGCMAFYTHVAWLRGGRAGLEFVGRPQLLSRCDADLLR